MNKEFDNARYAVGAGYKYGLPHALAEYKTFLEHLEEMRPRLEEISVSFAATNPEAPPTKLIFDTPLGEIVLSRVLVLDGRFLTVAVTFHDVVSESALPVRRNLCAIRLGWNSDWKTSDGEEVKDEFRTNAPSPLTAFTVVHHALTKKLLLDTERWFPLPQGTAE